MPLTQPDHLLPPPPTSTRTCIRPWRPRGGGCVGFVTSYGWSTEGANVLLPYAARSAEELSTRVIRRKGEASDAGMRSGGILGLLVPTVPRMVQVELKSHQSPFSASQAMAAILGKQANARGGQPSPPSEWTGTWPNPGFNGTAGREKYPHMIASEIRLKSKPKIFKFTKECCFFYWLWYHLHRASQII